MYHSMQMHLHTCHQPGETWKYEQNSQGGECRFNACNGAFIVSFKDNKYYKIDLPKY